MYFTWKYLSSCKLCTVTDIWHYQTVDTDHQCVNSILLQQLFKVGLVIILYIKSGILPQLLFHFCNLCPFHCRLPTLFSLRERLIEWIHSPTLCQIKHFMYCMAVPGSQSIVLLWPWLNQEHNKERRTWTEDHCQEEDNRHWPKA